jgi:hypothetical protein
MKELIKEILECELYEKMIIKEGVEVTPELRYHIDNEISLYENEFRIGSKKYAELINEVRELYNKGKITLCSDDEEIINSDAGVVDLYEGEEVYLDMPYVDLESETLDEAKYQGKTVQLNKPKRGGSKKFYVYVRDPKTKKVKKVSFGAAGGGGKLSVKLKDPKARKRFADRHNCEQKNDKTKAGYWSCRLPRYAKSLGLSGGGTWW